MNDLSALTARLGLGAMIGKPQPLTGGLLHRVWRVKTAGGDCVVKAVNPEIAARDGALASIENGERIGAALSEVVPAVAALDIGGRRLHALDGRWCAVYSWVDGRAVFPPAITAAHCAAVGDALGRMHRANLAVPGIAPKLDPPPSVDWRVLLALAPTGAAWYNGFKASLPKLIAWTDAAREADALDADAPVLSHRDLDPKNVLWRGRSPVLIDWEAAGHVRPRRELLEVALYWADDGHGGLDAALCEALLTAYAKHAPPRGDWEPVFAAGRATTLEWLAYSVRRASGLTSPDEAEVRRGEAEVGKTIEALEGYEAKVDGLKRLLR